ncbi:HD domain-containing protein [Ruminococcus sp. YE71]|uniref:HD domain-containing phosphohydrolase n=1 Tax=unclassified Ruminococcus TaxID=2608920 RepID=UPI00088F2DF2|nr:MULTISPECIES: HD domain-containing phosphohydrolase [unclassified Ruminococcus]SDA10434.1 HD domain-containing protein [Ruminococcus sp. YE78]SFW10720.1 HD domain-containing protein [Ruminococcus sp. YE71]
MSCSEIYYLSTFAASLVLTMIYMFIWHKHFDVHITLIFVMVPITNLGFYLLSETQSLEAAVLANKVCYIGGCYQILIIMLTVFSLCRIKLPKLVRMGLYLLTSFTYLASLTAGKNASFYKNIGFVREDGTSYLIKEYGPLHDVFYIMIFVYFALSVAAIVYCFFKKTQVSNQLLLLMFLPEVICIVAFFGGRKVITVIELVPVAYVFAQFVYLVIVYRMMLYDITDSGIDSLVQADNTGFISFDFSLNYLGSNETARRLLPDLEKVTVDKPVKGNANLEKTVLSWLTDFIADDSKDRVYYETGDKTYLVDINYLYDGKRRRGYQLFLNDDTQNRKYVALIEHYNDDLEKQVSEKTANLVSMHNNLIMSMATMVESRDNSTGGHIKRTSEGVRILVEEIRKGDTFELSDEFCEDIIKAAPMHDLGKIAVDDAILRKPGRFEPWEFEKMKAHAAEGARIVHEVLKDTDDYTFHIIAENVAHYHHERWDGSGYPEGLKGDRIPLEARIMAIADVYDALVSKRVYKESMSFEKADRIIMEGMGTQFDKRLEPYYVAARPNLEAYYSSLSEG